ncbi:MAG: hypothetical protein WBW46_10640 [Candidatus Sulfotelmatobacter sp.]
MTSPLQKAQQKLGGQTRADNQTGEGRRFLATLAAHRRPLLHDVKITNEELLWEFRNLSKDTPNGRPWIILLIVGANGRTIRSTLADEVILHRLKLIGGAIGFMGLTVFGSPHKGNRAPSIQVYYKPLKKGTVIVEKLQKVSRDVLAAVIPSIQPVTSKIETEVGD